MNLAEVSKSILAPTFADVLPGRFNSTEAKVMLLAIGLQESRFQHRKQIGGPARGFWQFERGGGVHGVLNHGASARHAAAVCAILGYVPSAPVIYDALAEDDRLACAFARLLLFTDPKPLPPVGDLDASWDYYVRNWRPGKPHRKTWDALYLEAMEALA